MLKLNMQQTKTFLLNARQIEQRINRIAYEIYEDNFDEQEIIIAGIANAGFVFAKQLEKVINNICDLRTQLIKLTLDKENPVLNSLEPALSNESLKNKVIIVVDDVLNSGKTLMYSLRPFLEADIKKIRTVLLVNRDHKRYPVEADFVGITLSTTLQEHVTVILEPGNEVVYLS